MSIIVWTMWFLVRPSGDSHVSLRFVCGNIMLPITTFLATAKSARLVPLSLDPSYRLKLPALLIIESFFTHFSIHAFNYFNVTFWRLLVRPIQSIINEFLMASYFSEFGVCTQMIIVLKIYLSSISSVYIHQLSQNLIWILHLTEPKTLYQIHLILL